MPSSMTAFARVESKHPWGTLAWELRSVNHRYLEPHFRLPEPLREIEPKLRELLRKHLARGKVEINLSLQINHEQQTQISIDQQLAQQLVNAAEQINDLLADQAPISALELLRWPGVMQTNELDRELASEAAISSFVEALEQLKESRLREGAGLAQHITQRLNAIAEQVKLVRQWMPDILQNQRDKLVTRLEAVTAEPNPDRLEQELVFWAQRADVAEELDRLDTHLDEVRRVLGGDNAIGRRLDFLMQELNREANTLSSKSVVGETTQAAVEIKVLIEQMREQIQNIE